MSMPAEIPDIVKSASPFMLLVLALYAGIKRHWVFGWTFTDMEKQRDAAVLRAEEAQRTAVVLVTTAHDKSLLLLHVAEQTATALAAADNATALKLLSTAREEAKELLRTAAETAVVLALKNRSDVK